VSVVLELGADKGYQWKTHPFIDKALHAQQGVLALKDPEKHYQIGASFPLLKWRMQVGAPHLSCTLGPGTRHPSLC
jgi:hypothetical protein